MSTNAKHTAGRWEHGNNGSKTNVVAWCTAGRQTVAECYIEYRDGDGNVNGCNQTKATAEANARLIAATPELLEALKELVALFPISNQRDYRALAQARAAIAKAGGAA